MGDPLGSGPWNRDRTVPPPAHAPPVVAVDFTASGDETELALRVRGIAGEPGDDNVYDGWTQALENLASHVAR